MFFEERIGRRFVLNIGIVPRSLGLVCIVVVVGEPFPLAARRVQCNWMLDAGVSGTRHQTRLHASCLADCCFSAVREVPFRCGGGQIQSKLGADYIWLPSCILEKHRSVVISRSVVIVFGWRREQSGRRPCSPREAGKREVVRSWWSTKSCYGDLTQRVSLDVK